MSTDTFNIVTILEVRTDDCWSESLTFAAFKVDKKIKILPNFNKELPVVVHIVNNLHTESVHHVLPVVQRQHDDESVEDDGDPEQVTHDQIHL